MTSKTPQLDHGPTLRPQGGDVVRRVAGLGQLQEQPERHRTGPQPAFQLLAQEARASLCRRRRGEKSLACLRHEAIAAESARAIHSGEAEGVLGMVDRLRIAGRHRLLHQPLDEGASGGMAGEKAWNRIGVGPAAARLGELSSKELEQLLGRPRDEPFDGVGEDVGALAIGELKLDCDRAHVGDTIVHVGVPVGIGEPDDRRHRLTGEMGRPSDAGSIRRSAKRSRTDEALGVDGTEARMWAGQRPHGFDYLTDDGFRCGRCRHTRLLSGITGWPCRRSSRRCKEPRPSCRCLPPWHTCWRPARRHRRYPGVG